MTKINGNEIRPGMILDHSSALWVVVRVEHVKPGKGGAFAQAELRNLRNASKLNERFRSADRVERVRLEQRAHQFLYAAGDALVFMDLQSFDQIEIPAGLLGRQRSFLQDGMEVMVEFFETEPLQVSLPQRVICTVVDTEPVITGQTAANSFKPATLDNGIRIMVPPFVSTDTDVAVNTETFEYMERA